MIGLSLFVLFRGRKHGVHTVRRKRRLTRLERISILSTMNDVNTWLMTYWLRDGDESRA